MQISFFLCISVQKLQNLSHLQPNGGWTNSNMSYSIGVHCKICDIQSDESYLELFLVDDKGDCVSWDSDIEDWIEIHGVGAYLKPSQANYVHGSWMREKPLPDSDSDFDSTSDSECYSDSDTDSD